MCWGIYGGGGGHHNKKDKNKRYIKSWRPISPLNVDLKIASKALALRIKPVLKSVICHDQTAYIKDRYIGESIRLVQDIIEYVHVPNFGGLSGSEDRGDGDSSIQFINFGRVGDKIFKE